MNTTLWAACFAVLILLAIVDLVALWRISARETKRFGWFSPFTLACQAAFAVFAAFHAAPKAFEGFSSADAILYAELAFLTLMVAGAVADWFRKPVR